MFQAQLCIADSIEQSIIPEAFKRPSLDVYHYTDPVFTIAAVRNFIDQVYRQPFVAEVSAHIIAPHTISVEAQQALLKVLEEPPAHAQIYLVLADAAHLLATVRSRLLLLTVSSTTLQTDIGLSFLQLSYQDRIALITDLTTKKMTQEIDDLVSGLSVYAHQTVKQTPALAQALLFVEQHSNTRGASKKMLLEHLALLLPVRAT